MPLPEGLDRAALFAGMLNARRFRLARRDGIRHLDRRRFRHYRPRIDPERTLPEGPFGDHLGYYSLAHHGFPVLDVDDRLSPRDAVWPFTVVGRPPQEDTTFGKLIHEITAPMVPVELPGVKGDPRGGRRRACIPLLLAIGERALRPVPGERADSPGAVDPTRTRS